MPLEQWQAKVEAQPNEPPQVGDTYRNYAGRLMHVRGLVDDQVMFRFWNKRKGWIYACEPLWYFEPEYGFVMKVKS